MEELTFFEDSAAFRAWLTAHATTQPALSVGFYTVASKRKSITWPQSVDEALCVGWIDGVRRNVDSVSYAIRFTPRKPSSHWSAVNIARVAVLTEEGRMQPAGLAAFARRTDARSRKASYEQPHMPELDAAGLARFQHSSAAWTYFQAQPVGYRKRMLWTVMNAKQEATRARRLQALIEACARQERL